MPAAGRAANLHSTGALPALAVRRRWRPAPAARGARPDPAALAHLMCLFASHSCRRRWPPTPTTWAARRSCSRSWWRCVAGWRAAAWLGGQRTGEGDSRWLGCGTAAAAARPACPQLAPLASSPTPSDIPLPPQVLRALGLLPDDDMAALEALNTEVEQVRRRPSCCIGSHSLAGSWQGAGSQPPSRAPSACTAPLPTPPALSPLPCPAHPPPSPPQYKASVVAEEEAFEDVPGGFGVGAWAVQRWVGLGGSAELNRAGRPAAPPARPPRALDPRASRVHLQTSSGPRCWAALLSCRALPLTPTPCTLPADESEDPLLETALRWTPRTNPVPPALPPNHRHGHQTSLRTRCRPPPPAPNTRALLPPCLPPLLPPHSLQTSLRTRCWAALLSSHTLSHTPTPCTLPADEFEDPLLGCAAVLSHPPSHTHAFPAHCRRV